MAAVVTEARKNGARIPWSYWSGKPLAAEEYLAAPMINDPICRFDCDIPVDGVAAFVFTSAERARDLPAPPRLRVGVRHRSPGRRAACRCTGPSTTSWRSARRRGAGCGNGPASGRPRWTSPRSTTGSRPSSTSGWNPSASVRSGKPIGWCSRAGIDSDRPGALPVLSGGGALGNGRMHGVPQMLECYLQLSGRAGERQRPNASVGVACHSSPHFGGAVVYSADPF